MVDSFIPGEIWFGSFYELAIELGPRSDGRLEKACARIWDDPRLDGPYDGDADRPEADRRVDPATITSGDRLQGVATLPTGDQVICGSFAVREDDSEIDWIGLCIPTDRLHDALGTVYRSPHTSGLRAVDAWYASIGERVFREVPFALGLVGEEASGMHYASEIATSDVKIWGYGALVPKEGALEWTAPDCRQLE